jgi:hypothetical protein
VDLALAKEQLRSHRLKALFTQSLGWQSIPESPVAYLKAIQRFQQRCVPIAYRDRTVVWKVLLTDDTRLSSTMSAQIYQAIAQACQVSEQADLFPTEQSLSMSLSEPLSEPLVILIDAAKTRSLWFQSPEENALYVADQPIALWEFRLRRLAQSAQGLFPKLLPQQAAAQYETFERLVKGLYDGISGISNSADRQRYAALTLQRLIFVQSMQQKGWLSGDRWYLQTRFGEASAQARFFKTCLQPLYQGFALPEIERPLALREQVGKIPFLGYFFSSHPLEQQYQTIDIPDQPFEEILGWLSEQTHADALNPWMNDALSFVLERYWAQQGQFNKAKDDETKDDEMIVSQQARLLGDRTIDSLLLSRIERLADLKNADLSKSANRHPEELEHDPFDRSALNNQLFNATPTVCRRLVQEVLPALRILDPACGSGHILAVMNQRLLEISSLLTGYLQQTQDTQLKIWQLDLTAPADMAPSALEQAEKARAETANHTLLLNLQKRLLKDNLYGVDISPGAVETAHFQLLLHVVAIAQQPSDIEPLIDLSFNIMTGNSLIGLIAVDEERFDQVGVDPTNSAGILNVLQGNLLQPLAADGYQTILAEKNLALEHYKSRNQLLAKASHIPDYARSSLLRVEIAHLDAKAQNKLNALLLNHMSQQLGIQYKAMQLTDKPERRLLTLEDIDILQPFHWGYHFNNIIQRGGFDGVVCNPPWGAFKPTAEEFFQRFQDLAQSKGMSAKTLKTSKQALAKGDPEVAQAWLFYQEQYAYVADYFYRSEQYAHQNPTVSGKYVRNQLAQERLFVEQCFNLLALNGIGLLTLPTQLLAEPKAETLLDYLNLNAQCDEQVCETNCTQLSDQKMTAPKITITVLSLQRHNSYKDGYEAQL